MTSKSKEWATLRLKLRGESCPIVSSSPPTWSYPSLRVWIWVYPHTYTKLVRNFYLHSIGVTSKQEKKKKAPIPTRYLKKKNQEYILIKADLEVRSIKIKFVLTNIIFCPFKQKKKIAQISTKINQNSTQITTQINPKLLFFVCVCVMNCWTIALRCLEWRSKKKRMKLRREIQGHGEYEKNER